MLFAHYFSHGSLILNNIEKKFPLQNGKEGFVIHSFACLTDRIFTCVMKATTFWPHHENCRRDVVKDRCVSQTQYSKLNLLIWSPA